MKKFYILLIALFLVNGTVGQTDQAWSKSFPIDYGWVLLGNAGFSSGDAAYTSLAFSPSGEPYVAYCDYYYPFKATVMYYNAPAGITETNSSRMSLYPNPTSNTINLSTPSKGSVFIHSISGQQLLQKEITEPNTSIDVSGLKSGVYFVRVIGEKKVMTGKFVKQ